jgi:hypothetical protein
MRDDMYKLIVERPRRGSRHAIKSDGRIFRNSEDAPAKVGVRRGYHDQKSLNENLAPLRRFLESQVGRPWSKVYAELSAGIDRRNTVQEHIYTHIEDYVETHTYWDASGIARPNNGQCVRILGRRWRRGDVDLAHCYSQLLRNRYYRSYSNAWRSRQNGELANQAMERIRVSADCEYRRIDAIWYEIEFVSFPGLPKGATQLVWDALSNTLVSGASPDRYACRKRQMSHREIEQMKKARPGLFLWGEVLLGFSSSQTCCVLPRLSR